MRPVFFRLFYPVTAWLLGLFFGGSVHGQVGSTPMRPFAEAALSPAVATVPGLDLSQDLSGQFVDLDSLSELAVNHSPLVRYQEEMAVSQDANYRLARMQILQNLAGFANYSGGNQAILSTTTLGTDALGQIANGHRFGVNLQVNLYDLLGRPQQVRRARADYRASARQKEIATLQVQRELITVYQDMLTTHRVLNAQLQDEQMALTVFRLAEVEAQARKIDLQALAAASNQYARIKATVEQARGDFLKNLLQLELLVGAPLPQLIRN
ncbi:MAG: TolC family protein [Cytophagaceae bacterium]|nr:TolC family protein [Cytophagaceae bacterium]